jgi:hypothetical protein
MTEYTTQTTTTPPVLREIDGTLYIEVISGPLTLRAPLGDGSWFFSQVVEKLVAPALRVAAESRSLAAREELAEQAQELDMGYASPND